MLFVDGMRYTWPAKAKIVGIVVAFLFVLGYHLTRLIGGYGLHLGNEFRKAMSGESNPRKEENLVAKSWAAALDWKDKHWPERVPEPIDWKVVAALLLALALLASMYGYGVSNAGNWNWLWNSYIVPPAGGVDWTDIVFGGIILLIVVASVVAIVCAFAFAIVYLLVALWALLVRFWRWLRRLDWRFILSVALVLLVFGLIVAALYALVNVYLYTTTNSLWTWSWPKLRSHPDWDVVHIGVVSLPWLYAIGGGIIAVMLGYFNRARIARMFRRINIARVLAYAALFAAVFVATLIAVIAIGNGWHYLPHFQWGQLWQPILIALGAVALVAAALWVRKLWQSRHRRYAALLAAATALALLLGSLGALWHDGVFSTNQAVKPHHSASVSHPKNSHKENKGNGKHTASEVPFAEAWFNPGPVLSTEGMNGKHYTMGKEGPWAEPYFNACVLNKGLSVQTIIHQFLPGLGEELTVVFNSTTWVQELYTPTGPVVLVWGAVPTHVGFAVYVDALGRAWAEPYVVIGGVKVYFNLAGPHVVKDRSTC